MTFADLGAAARRAASFAVDTGLKAAELYAGDGLGVGVAGLGSWALHLGTARGPARRRPAPTVQTASRDPT